MLKGRLSNRPLTLTTINEATPIKIDILLIKEYLCNFFEGGGVNPVFISFDVNLIVKNTNTNTTNSAHQ
ncbi:hypothetical protein AGMMS50222_04130 [Endomicrobiia bacterium]|nr:hypothetical protein AGMMS49531_05530 [Endomicrobiia bacterium]GHT65119.1 hypothetical protein AGMMS49556_04380 [Endomicrobiia bacterium]GHT74640.1 hypothetical protein AGMMS50222_04130 [Endomicrobiia bacterium]